LLLKSIIQNPYDKNIINKGVECMGSFKRNCTMSLLGLFAATIIFVASSHAETYTVKSGDSLWKIALNNQTSVQEIMEINQLRSYNLYPGQSLNLPEKNNVYSVQSNDTLWKISQRTGIPLSILIKANPQIKNFSNLLIGTKITLPEVPSQFTNGVFPIKGSYTPFTNNYGDGRSWSPTGDTSRNHSGVDIMAQKGTPVQSVMDGTVINAGWNSYGGWRLTVRVDGNTAFYYAHMDRYAAGIEKGVKVKKGQIIGYVGSSGYGPIGTTGNFENHLHFGIYKTDQSPWKTIDPYINLKWWELQNK
jgi:murein DD-endopeptidase MepM/ murein hydrolase activator NlpD